MPMQTGLRGTRNDDRAAEVSTEIGHGPGVQRAGTVDGERGERGVAGESALEPRGEPAIAAARDEHRAAFWIDVARDELAGRGKLVARRPPRRTNRQRG